MEPPDWLNTKFMSAAISDGQVHVDVVEYAVTPAVPEGSNYLSCIYRGTLNYKNEYSDEIQSTSLIIKTPLSNGVIKDIADRLNTVDRELAMYTRVLPKINKYLGEETVSAKKYFSLKDDVLVLADLNLEGYIMCDRLKQLDHGHCLSLMRALGRFHASSVALHEQDPELVETVGKEILFASDTSWSEKQSKMTKECFTYTANALNSVKSYEMFGELVLQQIDTVRDKLLNLFSKGTHIKVLNHGDLWTNNILFKHDVHGMVTSVKLVDFQMCRYASPGIDIQYFLVTCPNEDVRRSGFGDLLEEYRRIFNATLRTLNCNIQLSAEELEEEVKSAEPFALFVVCCMLAIMVADPENPPKLSDDKDILESRDPKINTFLQIYYGERFLELAVDYLKRLKKSGYFS